MSAVVAAGCSAMLLARRAPASQRPRLLLGGRGLLLRRLRRSRGGGLVTRGAALLCQPRLELSLSGPTAHLHRAPVVSSSHRPAILGRVGAVKSGSRRSEPAA